MISQNEVEPKTESVGLIVRQWNALSKVKRLWDDFQASHEDSRVRFWLYLLDDASNDGSAEELSRVFPAATILYSKQRVEYCIALNRLAKVAISDGMDHLFFCNADCYGFSPLFLDNILEEIRERGLSWASPTVENPEGFNLTSVRRTQHFGVDFGIQTEAHLISSGVFEALRGFDENLIRYGEDVELMARFLALGFQAGTSDRALIVHEEGGLSSRQSFVTTYFVLRNAFIMHARLRPPTRFDRNRWISGAFRLTRIRNARPFPIALLLWILALATGISSGLIGQYRIAPLRDTSFKGSVWLRNLLLALDLPLERFASRASLKKA